MTLNWLGVVRFLHINLFLFRQLLVADRQGLLDALDAGKPDDRCRDALVQPGE